MAPAKNALISSYFTQSVGKSAETSTSFSPTPPPSVLGSRTEREEEEGEEEEGGGGIRVAKQARVQANSTSGALANVSNPKLQQWKFNHVAYSQQSGPSQLTDGETSAPLASQTPRTAEQEARHVAFKAKLLGTIEKQKKREEEKRKSEMEVESNDEEGQEGEEEAEPEKDSVLAEFAAPKQKGRPRATKETSDNGIKYTPLEKQFLELRKAHPDVLLCVEVGYKFKFYGDDARVASRELNIACFMEKHLWTAMVPLHRLQLHIKKLVSAGHKVGVVRQMETRALKAASTNASKPFTRELTELYTASTWVDDDPSQGQDESNPSSPKSLVAIVEKVEGGTIETDDKVSIGLIAIQATTGTITYDQFTDGSMRSELETRLAHLEPAEMILCGQISRQTSRLMRYIAGQSFHSATAIRIEESKKLPSYNEAYASVGEFYAKGGFVQDEDIEEVDTNKILSVVIALPRLALIALAVTIEHLSTFKLESVFRLATNFTSFASRHEMLLTGNTLSNLEILENNTDFREKGVIDVDVGSWLHDFNG